MHATTDRTVRNFRHARLAQVRNILLPPHNIEFHGDSQSHPTTQKNHKKSTTRDEVYELTSSAMMSSSENPTLPSYDTSEASLADALDQRRCAWPSDGLLVASSARLWLLWPVGGAANAGGGVALCCCGCEPFWSSPALSEDVVDIGW